MKEQTLLVAILSVAGILACGLLGWIAGALIGGNVTTDFVYQGLPGYEGTGMLGSHIGITLSVLIIGVVLGKNYKKNTHP